jgi:AraC family transcriptional activator FtrA
MSSKQLPARSRCPASRSQLSSTSGRGDIRTSSNVHFVALAVTDGTPLFGLAAMCEGFGVERDLARSVVRPRHCGPDTTEVGGKFRADIRRRLNTPAPADTLIVPACRGVEDAPRTDLVDTVGGTRPAPKRFPCVSPWLGRR